jgi:hypothetical protein
MANTMETPTEVREGCPTWCDCCTPDHQGGWGHLGTDHEVQLSLMKPKTGEDPFTKETYFHPQSIRVCLALPHGAGTPTVRIRTGERNAEEWKLDIGEAVELAKILDRLIDEAHASALPRGEKKVSTIRELFEIGERIAALKAKLGDVTDR